MPPNNPNRGRPPVSDPFKVPRKRKFQLPPWFDEHINKITIAALFLMFGIPIKLFLNFKACESGEPLPATQLARLAHVTGPLKIWKEGSTTHLKAIKVGIKNYGPAIADGMGVTITLHGATWVLYGPPSIEVGKVAEYGADVDWNVVSEDKIDVAFGCANCVVATENK